MDSVVTHHVFSPLENISRFIQGDLVPLFSTVQGLYPVLGAEDKTFYVELAWGTFEEREILSTIYIDIGCMANSTAGRRIGVYEFQLRIPSAAYLIGFLGLLQKQLGQDLRLLHPLDGNGNYLPEWSLFADL